MRNIKTTIITILLFTGVALSTACSSCGPRTAVDYQEYQQPFYANQPPTYVDGNYYVFVQNGQYRRVPRTYITYVSPTFVVPVLPESQRATVYQNIPKVTVPASRTQPGAANLTSGSSPSTTTPSTVPASRQTTPSKPTSASTVPSSRSTSTSSSKPSTSTVPSSRRR